VKAEMTIQKALFIMVFLVIGAILAIYIYDIFRCLFTDPPIPIAELTTFLTLLIGTISVVVALRKKLQSFIRD
jgi:TRAP-type C4-dicarboxylate transport system permease small subunit